MNLEKIFQKLKEKNVYLKFLSLSEQIKELSSKEIILNPKVIAKAIMELRAGKPAENVRRVKEIKGADIEIPKEMVIS
ncbi:hypothetical protein [Caminibacter pacificus]|uniref:Uncharacterized protein n=1 Tax=Caminibacter pacificus TaxID=1424653 RepID=A0AAJ4RB97_9BACT|nr:hypothetical protein [Caminibacter pacificus]QDD68150.1 hypothetical protein C6V80_09865 [Caminibacter pacificus]ROR38768.1 hypothetical protein EDC58_1983 [Caminibacter pacificus]